MGIQKRFPTSIKYSQNNPIDFSGQRFGKLTVLKKYNNYKDKFNRSLWECQCDCGSKIIVPGPNLKNYLFMWM